MEPSQKEHHVCRNHRIHCKSRSLDLVAPWWTFQAYGLVEETVQLNVVCKNEVGYWSALADEM